MFFGCRTRLDSGTNPRGRIGDFFSTGLFAAIGCRLRDALYAFGRSQESNRSRFPEIGGAFSSRTEGVAIGRRL